MPTATASSRGLPLNARSSGSAGAVGLVGLFLGGTDRMSWEAVGDLRVGSHRSNAGEIDTDRLPGEPGLRGVAAPLAPTTRRSWS
ncbi:MAG: hypothetical protein J2P17_33740, partial [Mycobacterium sp.]|nr:hypothetical protein [Mycobacterium sp.]